MLLTGLLTMGESGQLVCSTLAADEHGDPRLYACCTTHVVATCHCVDTAADPGTPCTGSSGASRRVVATSTELAGNRLDGSKSSPLISPKKEKKSLSGIASMPNASIPDRPSINRSWSMLAAACSSIVWRQRHAVLYDIAQQGLQLSLRQPRRPPGGDKGTACPFARQPTPTSLLTARRKKTLLTWLLELFTNV